MSESNIMTHNGGWSATREEVNSIELPKRTWSYTPVPHEQVITTLEDLIPKRNMKIDRMKLALASKGNRLFGVMDISNGAGQLDWGLALGFRNSYDKSMQFGLVGGSRVFICDNLAFSGDIVVNRRHIGRVDQELRTITGNLLDAFVATKEDIAAFIDSMKMKNLSNFQAHDLICKSVRDGVLPTSHVSKVLEQWHEPKYIEFEPRTQWSLFNSFTEVAKDRTAGLQMSSTVGLTTLMKNWNDEQID